MSSPSQYLFLLFLLLIILVPAFLWKAARSYGTRAVNRIARVSNLVLHSARAWAPSRILQTLTMNNEPNAHGDASDSSSRWRKLIAESEAAIGKYLVPEIDTDLATFVRCVTFHVFLVVFLSVDPNVLVPARVQQVTEAISEFFNDGQGKSKLPLGVQKKLYEWLPRNRFPSSLARILPAYEALWRIVATIIVTCEDDETKSLRWVMLDFRDNPRDGQYAASFGNDEKSVSAITDDAVGHLTPITRGAHATGSNWPLSCIQYATPSPTATGGHPATVQEALKSGGLLAAMVIGRVGVHYEISGRPGDGAAFPWDQRRIFGVNHAPGHLTVNVFPHASTSRQAY